jgi:predicted amidohydrolase
MKVACLQFAPKLGDSVYNIQRANQLLEENTAALIPSPDDKLLWLVLPEMAFSGTTILSKENI